MTAIVAVGAARQGDESIQDDAVADLVLRAADDDDGSIGHDRRRAPAVRQRIAWRSPRPRVVGGTARRRGVRECARDGRSPGPGPPARSRARRAVVGRIVVDLSDVVDRGTRRRAGVFRRALRREASRVRDPHRIAAIILLSLTFALLLSGMIARGEAGGADARAYWAGRPDLAQRRRPVPPDRAVPALRLRALDAAAVHALGGPALGRGLVRLAGRDDPAAAVDDRLGLPAPAR